MNFTDYNIIIIIIIVSFSKLICFREKKTVDRAQDRLRSSVRRDLLRSKKKYKKNTTSIMSSVAGRRFNKEINKFYWPILMLFIKKSE